MLASLLCISYLEGSFVEILACVVFAPLPSVPGDKPAGFFLRQRFFRGREEFPLILQIFLF